MPDSQESLFTSLPSVADDPRGSPHRLDDVSALGQDEDPPQRGRSGRPAGAGQGSLTMSGNSLEVAQGIPSAPRGLFDVALGSQTMSGAPTSTLVATRSMDQPTDETARAGEAPQVGLDGRIGLLESQMMVIHRELRASRGNLIQAIKTSQEDFQRAATRIETLEFEWTVWNTEDGQAPPARDLPPGLPGSSGAGLITQPPVDLLGFDEANQAQSSTDGPTEFQLTPNYTPRSGGSQETGHHDSLMEWWRNPSPRTHHPKVDLSPSVRLEDR